MSAQIPEWFDDLLMPFCLKKKEVHYLWSEISKPQNAANIPEVAMLIEALEYHSDYHCEGCQFLDADALECGCFMEKAKEALAPFKGGE